MCLSKNAMHGSCESIQHQYACLSCGGVYHQISNFHPHKENWIDLLILYFTGKTRRGGGCGGPLVRLKFEGGRVSNYFLGRIHRI